MDAPALSQSALLGWTLACVAGVVLVVGALLLSLVWPRLPKPKQQVRKLSSPIAEEECESCRCATRTSLQLEFDAETLATAGIGLGANVLRAKEEVVAASQGWGAYRLTSVLPKSSSLTSSNSLLDALPRKTQVPPEREEVRSQRPSVASFSSAQDPVDELATRDWSSFTMQNSRYSSASAKRAKSAEDVLVPFFGCKHSAVSLSNLRRF